jgi:transcriptional regulator with XRE-family HTH domain
VGEGRRSQIWANPRTARAVERELVRLGARLREVREARGWTLEQTAERESIHPVSLSRVETGSVNVTIGTLVAVTRALGVELVELFGES